jgi:holo-[acyl-carrier protein] synthase
MKVKQFIGIDIIEIERIKRIVNRWGTRFLNRVYTDKEIELYKNKIESLAARFAAKEAAMKALSPPDMSFNWRDIEILNETDGRPNISLYGKAREWAECLGIGALDISLSHSKDNAIALVIGIKEE